MMTSLYDSTYSFERSVAKTRLTLVFKLPTFKVVNSQYKDTVFQFSIQHCTSQL